MSVTPKYVDIRNHRYHRQEYLIFKGHRVRCAPYDNHFLYYTTEIGPAYRCTCGSLAVVVQAGDGVMMVCKFHADNGHHTNTRD